MDGWVFLNNQIIPADEATISPLDLSILRGYGVTDYLLQNKKVGLKELRSKFKANEGYLNIALRGLCSQGWLIQHVDNLTNTISFKTNEESEIAFKYFYLFEDVTDLLQMSEDYHPRKFEIEPFRKLESIYKKYKTNYGLELSKEKSQRKIEEQILT